MFKAEWRCADNDTHKQLAGAVADFRRVVEKNLKQAKEESGSSAKPRFYISVTLTSGTEQGDISLSIELGNDYEKLQENPELCCEIVNAYTEDYPVRPLENFTPIMGTMKQRRVHYKIAFAREEAIKKQGIDEMDIENMFLASISKNFNTSIIEVDEK